MATETARPGSAASGESTRLRAKWRVAPGRTTFNLSLEGV